ncbi:flavin reductase family protein [Halonotius terrestris]|uniref:Flavin reductase family protein n=1 Tax=Halonotius terrestris TaxID=2487750 RepID=A0A8J8PBZ5_9EURY|nr:flavin reductase family protein [Halonotius terrestris]TQQ79992.1 flavin reductase family protein [Halonotius terrestris]
MATLDGAPDDFGSAYRLLSTAITPRPIGWISTTSTEGIDNLAPYSFCNVVAIEPPVVMFAPVGSDDLKNTPQNVADTEEFVLNTVTHDLVESMNATSATLPATESEFDHVDIDRAESVVIDPPRVAAARVALECELYDWIEVGGSVLILGEVVHAHVDERVLTDDKIDIADLDTVGRLAGSYYASTRDRFSLDRPS